MICRRCSQDTDRFAPKRRVCRDCQAAATQAWREANRDRHRKASSDWQKRNPEKAQARNRRWKDANPERHAEVTSKAHKKHRASGKKWAYAQERMSSDTNFRLRVILRSRLNSAMAGRQKTGSAVLDLGCSISELRAHLAAQFTPGMTWDNYGLRGWHIDHITPLASFDLTDREQLLQACHYSNLQPLWASDNLTKGATV